MYVCCVWLVFVCFAFCFACCFACLFVGMSDIKESSFVMTDSCMHMHACKSSGTRYCTTKIAPIHKMAGVCLPYIHAYSRFYLSLLSDCFVKEASQALSFLFCLSNTNTNTKLLYLAVDCCRRFDIDIDIDIAAARLAGRQAGRNTI
jgi:hypothetical protein